MRLRSALRARAAAAGSAAERTARLEVQAASEPLLDRMFLRLLRHCHGMVTSEGAFRPRRALFDADDLALEAWQRALRYLTEPSGDRIETDHHFWYLLRCAAANRLVDRLRRHSEELAREVPLTGEMSDSGVAAAASAVEAGPEHDALLWGADHRAWRLVELLFRHEDRFHVRFRQVTNRHPRQFRALVLYELGALLRRDLAAPDATEAGRSHHRGLMRRHAALLGIGEEVWARVETAAVEGEEEAEPDGGLLPALRDAVNAICDTSIRTRTGVTTLRYELKRILNSAPARGVEWK